MPMLIAYWVMSRRPRRKLRASAGVSFLASSILLRGGREIVEGSRAEVADDHSIDGPRARLSCRDLDARGVGECLPVGGHELVAAGQSWQRHGLAAGLAEIVPRLAVPIDVGLDELQPNACHVPTPLTSCPSHRWRPPPTRRIRASPSRLRSSRS